MCSPQATIQVKYRAGILASGGLCPHGQDSVCLPPNEVRLSSFPQWVLYSRPQHQNTEYRKQPEPKLQMYLNTAASSTRVAFKIPSLVWQLYSCIHYSTGNMPGVELLGIWASFSPQGQVGTSYHYMYPSNNEGCLMLLLECLSRAG